jgi:hypothetical protein
MKSHTLPLKELVKMRLALLLELEILLLLFFLALSVAAVCIAWFTKSFRAFRSPHGDPTVNLPEAPDA